MSNNIQIKNKREKIDFVSIVKYKLGTSLTNQERLICSDVAEQVTLLYFSKLKEGLRCQ